MKKVCYFLIVWMLASLSASKLAAQPDIVLEFLIPEKILELGDFEGFQPADMKYSPDGVSFTTCFALRIGQNLVIRKLGSPEFAVITPDDINDPEYNLDNYRILGFHNILGGAETEFVMVPKANNKGIIAILIGLFQGNPECASTSIDAYVRGAYVKNFDGDPEAEITLSVGNPFGLGGAITCGIYGEGFTPGLTNGPASEDRGTCMLNKFEVQKALPIHFRWPENRSFLPMGSNDFDGDGKNDFFTFRDSLFWPIKIISGSTHEVLFSSNIPSSFSNYNFRRVAYIDFCDSGQKQILLCGSNSGYELRDMEIILVIDPGTGEISEPLSPFLQLGYRAMCVCDLAEMLGVVGKSVVMENQNTGRVIIVGPETNFQGGSGSEFSQIHRPTTLRSGPYELHLVWESALAATTFMPIKRNFALEDLDLNMDGVLDIPALVLQDSSSNVPVGFYVYDGSSGTPIWQTLVQSGIDPAPYFHGFFDANGDGEKELLFGAETVQTADGEIHKPFSPGFVMEYIFDLNADGFEEILGHSPEGKIQVWSSSQTSSAIEARVNALGEIAVYPNPSGGQFALSWQQPNTGETRFELYDERGVKVYCTQLGNIAAGNATHQIQLMDHLPNGLYLGRICTENACTFAFLALQR